MHKQVSRFSLPVFRTFLLLSVVFLSSCALLGPKHGYVSHQLEDDSLVIQSEFGEVRFTALPGEAIEVHYLQTDVKQLPSFAKEETLQSVKPQVEDQQTSISFISGELTAVIDKSDLSVDFYRGSEFLVRQDDYFLSRKKRGFEFELDATEKIMGGGERVLGMDRRGHRMPLYNRAHYGYTLESDQMYFGLPVVLSDKHYALI